MQKRYITVESITDSDGVVMPVRIIWDDGRCWAIKKVLHTCTASHREFEGIRYTVKIGSAEKYIYRDGLRWYVGHSP